MDPFRIKHRAAAVAGLLMLACAMLLAQEALLPRLKRFEFGKSRAAWAEADNALRSTQSRERRLAERLLVDVLLARDATPDSKILACRGLRYASQSESIAALISLLRDPRVSTDARCALEAKRSPEIDAALRNGLTVVPNALKSGFLSTLARRGDRDAVEIVAQLVKTLESPELRIQAIRTLGQLSGPAALRELNQLKISDDFLGHQILFARLTAARRILERSEEGQDEALKSLQDLLAKGRPEIVRLGALYELARYYPDRRLDIVKQALTQYAEGLLESVPSIWQRLDEDAKRELYAGFFDTLTPRAKMILVTRWEASFGQVQKLRELSIDTSVPPDLRKAILSAVNREE